MPQCPKPSPALALALALALTCGGGLDLLGAHGEAQRGEGLVEPEERWRETEEHRRPAVRWCVLVRIGVLQRSCIGALMH